MDSPLDIYLAHVANAIFRDEKREIQDSHDYSSSRYSGFDDGHNVGIEDGLDLLIERVHKASRLCSGCQRVLPHLEEDYLCILCRAEPVDG